MHGPVRGQSDVELSVVSIEDDENVTYLGADETVRYVAHWAGPKQEISNANFATEPFESWSRTRCLKAAGEVAAKQVNDVFGKRVASGGVSATRKSEDGPDAIVTAYWRTADCDGGVVHETDIEFEEFVAATPSEVTATYRLGDRKRTLTVPIYAEFLEYRDQ
ncbi:hypothetical protein [Haloarchaeobius amylolyticus]|uniref:hypothetical protein n=1 Tax=Haloarchaeobius amylolyticus TaxID=1198296 RepID=UPI00226D4A38|nr:hypothetical protein [Haloarchaeobius amylolyticus]